MESKTQTDELETEEVILDSWNHSCESFPRGHYVHVTGRWVLLCIQMMICVCECLAWLNHHLSTPSRYKLIVGGDSISRRCWFKRTSCRFRLCSTSALCSLRCTGMNCCFTKAIITPITALLLIRQIPVSYGFKQLLRAKFS